MKNIWITDNPLNWDQVNKISKLQPKGCQVKYTSPNNNPKVGTKTIGQQLGEIYQKKELFNKFNAGTEVTKDIKLGKRSIKKMAPIVNNALHQKK